MFDSRSKAFPGRGVGAPRDLIVREDGAAGTLSTVVLIAAICLAAFWCIVRKGIVRLAPADPMWQGSGHEHDV
jgi:hypothetical protein